MGRVNRYEFQGEVIQVPVVWDEALGREAEDYEDYYAGPVYTPAGCPVLLTIEDACPDADLADGGVDCGSCRRYHQFPSSLLGVCNNEKRRKKRRARRSGQSTKTKEEMT